MLPYRIGLTDNGKAYLALPGVIYFSEYSVTFDKNGNPKIRYYPKSKSNKNLKNKVRKG